MRRVNRRGKSSRGDVARGGVRRATTRCKGFGRRSARVDEERPSIDCVGIVRQVARPRLNVRRVSRWRILLQIRSRHRFSRVLCVERGHCGRNCGTVRLACRNRTLARHATEGEDHYCGQDTQNDDDDEEFNEGETHVDSFVNATLPNLS